MLASSASITFPALIFHEDDDYYEDIEEADDLFLHHPSGSSHLLGGELIDSTGQCFSILSVASAQPIEIEIPVARWRQMLGLRDKRKLDRCDFHLKPLPHESFDETLRRVTEMEAAQEADHIMQGGGRDTPEHWEQLSRCRSIADIIAYNNYLPPGAPRTVGESIVQGLKRRLGGLGRP
ncbi:MAG: hypothetical protein J0I28_09790 [Caulobacterales bacterium]|nr:hypothetical protein [Caulobacterales bacterium]